MLYKVVSKTSETRSSIDKYDMDYLFQLYEAISFDEHIEKLYSVEQESRQVQTVPQGGANSMAAAMANNMKGRR